MERWKPIPGWEGYYSASTHGRIKSHNRTQLVRSRWGGVRAWRFRGKVLRQQPNTNRKGYLQVTLASPTQRRMAKVHQLVLETFVGPKPLGRVGRHKDCNVKNNRLSNLRWGTPVKNAADTRRANGGIYPTAKLTPYEVSQMRWRYQRGWSIAKLARWHGTSESNARKICKHRRTWRGV